MHEVTTFRADVETDGRHAVVRFGDSLDEDLARRDFTINAIAYSPSRDELRDPFGGRRDIASRTLRAVGVPKERMREDQAASAPRDPLRGSLWICHGSRNVAGDSRERAASRSPVSRASAAGDREDDEPGCVAGWRVRNVAGQRSFRRARSGSWRELPTSSCCALDHLRRPILVTQTSATADSTRRPLFAAARPGTVLATLKALRFSNADVAWIGGLVERWHEMGRRMKR